MTRTHSSALLALALLCLCPTARAESGDTWLSLAQATQPAKAQPAPAAVQPAGPAEPQKWERPLPLYFGLDYVLASDYIFRGVNFSEFAREGREKPSHQLTVWVEYDTGVAGTVGGYVWFDWFAANRTLVPGTDSNLYEADYALYWRYNIEKLYTTVEIGWAAYTYPPFTGDFHTTYELWGKLTFDDSVLFGTKGPVFNPYVQYWHDYDVVKGGWLELGAKHDFALAELGMGDVPVLKDITVTPSLALGMDHRYNTKALGFSPATRLGNIQYGLDVVYNVSQALGVHERWGVVKVGPFLRFSQALFDEITQDEFWGGLKVSYAW
ncbi:MAG: hypothetical protein BWX88_00382 [Planctomycetes bacterium ADurb.Bin126]|nr:MAG: hypothetical protein BWX88_00382 [Planctomycetes bacterium ADurb.Bin126]HOD81278.1 hypothetical protein [Phycisphaerae bacterium]HQL71606.1 hypothetical protein [Phycisphaerae bacterium]